jgi:hypothetical protein
MLRDHPYIPTRHLNGLPGGVPAEALLAEDADRALSLVAQGVAPVSERLRDVEVP